tara:strand:- start:161 stop:313 length:153 start_codon:yes stop_codon:yes gene_type:complete
VDDEENNSSENNYELNVLNDKEVLSERLLREKHRVKRNSSKLNLINVNTK